VLPIEPWHCRLRYERGNHPSRHASEIVRLDDDDIGSPSAPGRAAMNAELLGQGHRSCSSSERLPSRR
jgi:hypothetical protein